MRVIAGGHGHNNCTPVGMKYASIALVLASFSCQSSTAQFNDSVHHNIGFSALGSINQTTDGNAYLLNNAVRYSINKKNRYLNSNASWIYGQQNAVLTNNDALISADFDVYGFWPKWYYWGLVTGEKNYSLKINNRLQTGVGLGYTPLTGKDASLSITDGPLYEYSDLAPEGGNRDIYNTVRNSLRLKYHFLLAKVITLDGVHFWQQSLISGPDYIIRSSSSVSVKLKKWLSLSSAVNYNKVNRTGAKNLFVSFGLAIDYYY